MPGAVHPRLRLFRAARACAHTRGMDHRPCALIALALLLQTAVISDAQVRGVDHVGLTVTDLDRSTAFFTDTLGFTVRGGDE